MDSAGLGQFFTPRPVVELALDGLDDFGVPVAGSRVIDPACGPGQWLHAALARDAAEVVGVDCDPAMAERWRQASLASEPKARMICADALVPGLPPEDCFDLVVGNPPFGAELPSDDADTLRSIARGYHLHLGGNSQRRPREPSAGDIKRLRRFPTELLFLERFVALCRPGGGIAIVLPDGALANARWGYVRRWLLERLTVHAVVGLPRWTFRRDATSARTCLLLLRNAPPPDDHEVQLAELDDVADATTRALLRGLRERASIIAEPPQGLSPPPIECT